MVEEEKKMEETALREERERNIRLQKEREDDLKGGEEAMDSKFKRLQYLLGQSEVRTGLDVTRRFDRQLSLTEIGLFVHSDV